MIRWTGLASWEFEFPFPGSIISTFLAGYWRGAGAPTRGSKRGSRYYTLTHQFSTPSRRPYALNFFFFFTLVTGPRRSLSLKLGDKRVYEPQIWVIKESMSLKYEPKVHLQIR